MPPVELPTCTIYRLTHTRCNAADAKAAAASTDIKYATSIHYSNSTTEAGRRHAWPRPSGRGQPGAGGSTPPHTQVTHSSLRPSLPGRDHSMHIQATNMTGGVTTRGSRPAPGRQGPQGPAGVPWGPGHAPWGCTAGSSSRHNDRPWQQPTQ